MTCSKEKVCYRKLNKKQVCVDKVNKYTNIPLGFVNGKALSCVYAGVEKEENGK
jgi:hypothetical protein